MKNILLPIIFIILIILLLSYYYYINIREGFLLNNVDNSIYVNDNIDNINDIYKSSDSNDTDNTDNKRLNTYVITSETMVKSINYMKVTNKLPKNILGLNTDNFKLLIDPYINKYILNNNLSNTAKYKDGIFVCLSRIRFGAEKCIWDFTNKVIAYIYMSDYMFIQALIKSYRQDITKIQLRKIKIDDLKSSDKQFDYLFTYVVIGSEYMNILKYSKYFIGGLKDIDIYRLRTFYPFLKENYNSVRFYFNKDDDNTQYDIYLSNDKSLLPIMNYDILENIENFITRLEMPKDYLESIDEPYNMNELGNSIGNVSRTSGGIYGCYGNNKIVNKFECDSYYTKEGIPKSYYSIWDKKCSTNEECPYYKKNTRYENNRGGCINGSCEFPIGVKRIGFTKYNDEEYNSPLCYNCPDTSDLNCCANIKESQDRNGVGINNDYVFENDIDDRKKNNLNTIISLLDYRSI
jgi:hypothetical protein